jgi:deazaflavin-dependent oxidoreductase (nitroreductase family)
MGLGRLMGARFLLLTHTGRVTGKQRNAVLEIIRREPDLDVSYVVSAWGERSDWLQNVLANPEVEVQIGGRRFSARAVILTDEHAQRELQRYARAHPIAARALMRLIGLPYDGTPEALRALAQELRVVRISPSGQVDPSGSGERRRELC